RRHPRDRRRHLRRGEVPGVAGGDRRPGGHLQLPADQQSLQRVQPHPHPGDGDGTDGVVTALFHKVLVANRGAVAVRINRTLQQMGIASVAVYSDADAGTAAVLRAGEAVRLGPGPAAESYLLGERIVEAALRTGAEAVHPGYGFLSESADFAAAVEAAGPAFIGPTP